MILATVSVIECDGCKKITALKTDAEWEKYETEWSDSLLHQFCPDCKIKVKNRAFIETDNSYLKTMIKDEPEEQWANIIQ